MAFGGFGGFGNTQASQSGFGASSSSPFGQPGTGFGQQNTGFGAPQSGAGVFGASSTPAFSGAFGGQSSAAGFGSNAFGAKPASAPFGGGFGSPTPAAPSPFGNTQASFGASSSSFGFGGQTSTFGTPNAFGSQSTPAFGTSTPAFGTPSSTPAFGGASPGFGSPGFGQGGFGNFGQQQQQPQQQQTTGTRTVPWQKTPETEGTGSQRTTVNYVTISCMQPYQSKSPEELRWEDYQGGCKGNPNAGQASGFGAAGTTSMFGGQTPSPFGPASTPSPFGGPQSSPGLSFGNTGGGFGQPASSGAFSFSQSSPQPGWGTSAPFGGASQPAFGATPFSASSSAFGGGAFGSTAPKPGVFSAAPASAPSLFGTPGSTPAFGAASGGNFSFGGPQSSAAASSAFGSTGFGLGQSSPFGGASTFGQAGASPFNFSSPAPGQQQQQQQQQPAPAFGSTSFGFGQSSAANFGGGSSPAFSFSTPQSSGAGMFGSPGFGTSQPASGLAPMGGAGIFGQGTPAFGGGGSIFGTPQSQAGSSFSFSPQQPLQQPQQQQQLAPVALPSVGNNPYGALPQPLQVGAGADGLAELRTGLSSRPLAPLSGQRSVARTPALFTPRAASHSVGARLRSRAATPSRLASMTGSLLPTASPTLDRGVDGSLTSALTSFTPRANPRELFLREPLPSTEPAQQEASAGLSQSSSPRAGAGLSNGVSHERPGPSTERPPVERRTQEQPAAGSVSAKGKGSGRQAAANGGTPPAPSRSRTADEDGVAAEIRSDSGTLSDANARTPLTRHLKDSEVAKLLPKLTRPDYTTEPRLEQLAPLAREDPLLLAKVSNFVVARKGVGRIRWLHPVDVRGLDLDAIVRLETGTVEVYLDGSARAEVGEGLNKPAEVTLYGVYKKNPETGQPVTDPAAVESYRKRLRRLAANQKSRFIAYEPQGGVWRFEVDHFSKYGLIGLDEDSDEDMEEEGKAGGEEPLPKRRSPRSSTTRRRRLQAPDHGPPEDDAMSEEEEEEGEEVIMRPGLPARAPHPGLSSRAATPRPSRTHTEADLADDEDTDAAQAESSQDFEAAYTQQSLPEQLMARGLNRGNVARMLDAFREPSATPSDSYRQYSRPKESLQQPRGPAGFGAWGAPSRAHGGFSAAPVPGSLAKQQRLWQAPREQETMRTTDQAAAGKAASRAPGPGRVVWEPPEAPIRPEAPADGTPGTPSSSPPPLYPMLALPAPSEGSTAQAFAAAEAAQSRRLSDAGLFMGRSCRVAWSPLGHLAHTGAPPRIHTGQATGAQIIVSHISAHNPLAAATGLGKLDRIRRHGELAEQQLQLQLQHSSPLADGSAREDVSANERDSSSLWVPQWGLNCSRSGGLHELCSQMQALARGRQEQAAAQSLEQICLEHEGWTWQLVDVLFSDLPSPAAGSSDQDPEGTTLTDGADTRQQRAGTPEGMLDGASDADPNGAVEGDARNMHADQYAGPDSSVSTYLRFKRRACLSRWLQERAGQPGRMAVQSQTTCMLRIAHLLAAGCIHLAAALAGQAGDVALQRLILKASHSRKGADAAREQLAIWKAKRFLDHIDADRLLVYRLIAGQLDDVIPVLELDWRRAFGLHLWFGQPTSAGIAQGLASFDAAWQSGCAPEPLPPHATPSRAADCQPAKPSDVDHSLLHLEALAREQPEGCEKGSVAGLLRSDAMTPDPLDQLLPWRLLCLLTAVRVASRGAGTAPPAVVRMLGGVVEQLGANSQLGPWAVFAALHLPELGPDAAGSLGWVDPALASLRQRTVRGLVARLAPLLAESREQREFLVQRLRVPAEWVAEGLSTWAISRFDAQAAFSESCAARDYAAAHGLFLEVLAPLWFWRQAWEAISGAAALLQPHGQAAEGASGGLSLSSGAHLYTDFISLKHAHERDARGGRGLDDEPYRSFQQKLSSTHMQLNHLRHRKDTRSQFASSMLQVCQAMAAQVAAWWAEDVPGADVLSLPGLAPSARMLHIAAAATALAAGI